MGKRREVCYSISKTAKDIRLTGDGSTCLPLPLPQGLVNFATRLKVTVAKR